MDRGRESRRGGGGGGGGGGGAGAISGHAASRRRPRSGFKDSAAPCEEEEGLNESHDSTRLRERSSANIIINNNNNNNTNKKERSSLHLSRNKRRRAGLPERFQGGGRDRDNDEVDESSEESPVEDEEEDDDEPPHRPLSNPRRTTKFKSQWKVSEDMIGVGLVPVPRKARSASVKRPHDSTSSAVLLTSGVSDGYAHRRQKSPSPARPSVVPASPSSSNASVKPGRRMKPIGTKPRPSKMAKVSNSISDREVEVAEVLFGLTRQFHNHHPAGESYVIANANAKDYSNDGSAPAPPIHKVSSPLPTSSVVSSPISTSISPPPSSPALTLPHHSTSAPTPPTAPKKKRPRPAKPEEATPASSMRPPLSVSASVTMPSITSGARNDTESAYQAAKMEISSLKSEPDALVSVDIAKGIPYVATTTSASTISAISIQVSTPTMPLNQTNASIASEKIGATKHIDLKSNTSEKTAEDEISDPKMTSEKTVDGHSPDLKTIPSCQAGEVNSADRKCLTNEDTLGTKESQPGEKNQLYASEDLNKLVSNVSEVQSDQFAKKEIDASDTDLSSRPDKRMENANMLSEPPKTDSIVEEKFKIDLMAPPEKSSFDTEDDIVPDAVGNVAPEVPEEGTGEIIDISEVKAVTVKEERHSDKTKEESKVEETGKKYDKRDEGGDKILEKEHIKEQRGIDLQSDGVKLENVSSKPLPQNQIRAVRNESRTEKAEKPVLEATVTANIGGSSSAVASMPISMTVPGWPGALPLGYFAPAAANWPGAPSLPGMVPMEGANTTPAMQPPYILQKSRQTWKRCATHSYIARFIECQLQMTRHPFWTAANYFGSRQYNLNAPVPPSSEIINLGSSLSGTFSPASAGNSASISRGLESKQDKSIGSTPLSAKEKTSNYMDVRRKPSHQQATQQIGSTIMQPGHGFALSTIQSGAVGGNSSTAGSTGNVAVGAVPSSMTGPANSNLASIGADAQYMAMLQQSAMLHQGGYPFAINPPFGPTYSGASNHVGQQQAAQFFNAPFYATQLLHPPQPQPQPQSQQQGPQNPSTSSGSSSSQQRKKQLQGSRSFSSSQKQQQQQGTPSPSPSNSQQQHHLPMTQARHIDREANNEGDSPSTSDSRLPVLQKTFYSPGSPSSSNFSVTPPSLLASGLPVQAQELTMFAAALGGKHNGKQQQQPTPPQIQHQVAAGYNLHQHHGNDPTFQMSLKGLELSQSQAQAIAVMNRNSGGLCFPHMTQGHAMLQGITESARHQMAVQAQQNAVQQGTQPPHSGQMQRTQTTSTGDGRNSIDSMSNAGGRGRNEERKSSMKGGICHSMNFSRIETENSTNMQGSPTDGSLTTSLVANSIDSISRTPNAVPPALNGSRNSRPTSGSSQGSPHLASTQQLNQTIKQTASRAKTVPSPNVSPPVASAQITLSSYGDRTAVPSNLGKLQAPVSSYPCPNLKQGQPSPQWKMTSRTTVPSTIPTAVGPSSQAILAAEIKSFAQQGRNQHSNTNTGASAVCSPQASFVTSTKNSGQMPMSQKNNATSIAAPKLPPSNVASAVGSIPISSSPPVSKSLGSPSSRSPTGSKGPVAQQKSAAPTSNKKSSPVGSRSMPSVLGPSNVSQSLSGKSGQQQYQQQQQSMPAMASGPPVGLKNQQYHNQAHFNQQQLIFPQPQYLQQQAVQQAQFSAQTAHQGTGFHQKQQVGSNSPQHSFSSSHLRQQQAQQQQMQLTSSTSSTPGTLSLGPPTLTLGGASVGPAKTNPGGLLGGNSKGNTILHAQCSGQQQLGNPRSMLASPYMQAGTNVSSKSADQRVVASDVLSQEPINGVRICTSVGQNRSPFNTSSPQAASVRGPQGSLVKSGAGNTVESLNNPGGLSLSMAPSSGIRTNSGLTGSGNAGQNAKATPVSLAAVHSNQMPSMSIHQPPVPLAGGPATSASPGLHGQTAASVVQP